MNENSFIKNGKRSFLLRMQNENQREPLVFRFACVTKRIVFHGAGSLWFVVLRA